MRIVVANSVGRLKNGKHVVLFPSRWDWAGDEKTFSYYPYELAYLSSLLKRELPEHETVMVDGNLKQWDWQEYASFIGALKPDLLITECSALTYGDMTEAVMSARKVKDFMAFLCGPITRLSFKKCVDDGWDLLFEGEFEKNVLNRMNNRYFSPDLVDLDWLPWPEDNDICRMDYSECSNPYTGMVQLYPTRGCPMGCTFCVVPSYYGGHGSSSKSHRCRNVGNVCDEIQYLANKYQGKFNGCFFNDETHNANLPWLKSFCRELIKRGLNKYKYDAMCGYWAFDEESINLMAEAGYCYIRVGIESLSAEVGKAIKKTILPEKFTRFLEWCKKANIDVYGTSQIGAPGSTRELDLSTLDQLWKLKKEGLLDRWQYSISTPQPGTPFYDEVKSKGYLLTEDLSRFNGVEPVVDWPHYRASEVASVRQIYNARDPAKFPRSLKSSKEEPIPELKIAYHTRDDSGCTYYRQVWPMVAVAKQGLAQVLRVTEKDGHARQRMALDADVVQHSRVTGGALIRHLREVRKLGVKVAFDLDDALLPSKDGNTMVHPLSPHYHDYGLENYVHKLPDGTTKDVWIDGKNGFSIANNKERVELVKMMLSEVDLFTTTTQVLADHYRGYAKNIKVIPNFVDLKVLVRPEYRKRDDIRIFWQGGSSHFADLELMRNVIPWLLGRYKNLKILIGGQWFPSIKNWGYSDRVLYYEWTHPEAYWFRLLSLDYDISVIPLEDNEFNHCKSAIKWIEQGALGIPCVMSYVTPYKEVYNGENAVCIEDNDVEAWRDACCSLIEDRQARLKFGRAARKTVEEKYDLNTQAHQWSDAFQELKNGSNLGIDNQPSVKDSRSIRYWADSSERGPGHSSAESECVDTKHDGGRDLAAVSSA